MFVNHTFPGVQFFPTVSVHNTHKLNNLLFVTKCCMPTTLKDVLSSNLALAS